MSDLASEARNKDKNEDNFILISQQVPSLTNITYRIGTIDYEQNDEDELFEFILQDTRNSATLKIIAWDIDFAESNSYGTG